GGAGRRADGAAGHAHAAVDPGHDGGRRLDFVRGSSAMTARRGMTLVELLVVLTILAILAAAAMTATEVFVDQGRYDANARTLTSIREAVVGPDNARQTDGTVLVSGFVADMGRLPVAVGTDPTTALAELWANPYPQNPFAVRQAPSDPEVLIPSGW